MAALIVADILEKALEPLVREGIGAGLCTLAVLAILLRAPNRKHPGVLLLLAGLLTLAASFGMGVAARVTHTSQAWLDPAQEIHATLVGCTRYLAGIPLVILGAMGVALGLRRRGIVAVPVTGESPRSSEKLSKGVRDVVKLKDNLAVANRDLSSTKEELEQRSTEASQVGSKLRETLNLLLASEGKFRSIFERANDGFVIVDLASRKIVQANPRMAELTGLRDADLSGHELCEVFGPSLQAKDTETLRRLAGRTGLPSVEIQQDDGAVCRIEVSFSIIEAGESPVLLGIARDVSERERLNEELEKKNRELEERERNLSEANGELSARAESMREMNERLRDLQAVKDNFLSSVSHELRTPLTSIRSFSEILLQYQDADDEVKSEFITIINKESERLTRLINDVLDLAKIEAGEMKFDMNVVDLRSLVTDVARSLAPLAERRGMSVDSAFSEHLPAAEGDRDKLHQVLTNLISNALKFGAEGTTVAIGAGPVDDGMIEIRVRDRGPGIPADEVPRIFEKFRQFSSGDTLPGKKEGTGLGLAICREIVALHGGRIWVNSTVGEGATFHFTLRAYGTEKPDAEAASKPPAAREGTKVASGDAEQGEAADREDPPGPGRSIGLPPLRRLVKRDGAEPAKKLRHRRSSFPEAAAPPLSGGSED